MIINILKIYFIFCFLFFFSFSSYSGWDSTGRRHITDSTIIYHNDNIKLSVGKSELFLKQFGFGLFGGFFGILPAIPIINDK